MAPAKYNSRVSDWAPFSMLFPDMNGPYHGCQGIKVEAARLNQAAAGTGNGSDAFWGL